MWTYVRARTCLVGCLAGLLLPALLAPAASAVTVNWITIGDPGNAADGIGFGSIPYVYQIAETEVTNAQYTQFLNAVAASDPNGLYNTSMAFGDGGITRSGSAGSYSYSEVAGRENRPVNFVSFYDAARFSNWLHNHQLSGLQDDTTTEDGAYTITAAGIAANSITRNAGSRFALPDQDEWYKAAFYDAISMSYYDYPGGSDTAPTCGVSTGGANEANCDMAVGNLTDVMSYTGSPSPYGTFDQGGNVHEWNETIRFGPNRGTGGGGFESPVGELGVMTQLLPDVEKQDLGFRVARMSLVVPEPGTGLLVLVGLLGALRASTRRAR